MSDDTVDVKFGADASEAVSESKRFGDAVKDSIDKARGSFDTGTAAAVTFGSVIATVMEEVAKKIAQMVERAINAYSDLGDAVEKAQRRIGNSAEYVSGMKVSLDSVGLSMEQFQRVAQRLPQILETHGDKLREAGVEYLDMNGKMLDSTTIMMNISQHLEQYAAGAERNTEGNRLLGRTYRELADFVELTAERQKEAMAVAEEFGLVLSEKDTEASNEFGRQVSLLKSALEGFFVIVGKMLTPALTEAAEVLRFLLIPAYEVFRVVITAVGGLIEGFMLGTRLLTAALHALASPLELVAKLFGALWTGFTQGPAAGLAAVNDAVNQYKSEMGGLLDWVVSETDKTNARIQNLTSRPAAGGPSAGSGEDPARKKGADPIEGANAAARLAVIKETLAEELSAITAGHKAQELELSEFYARKLSITIQGLQAEKDRIAVDLAANAVEKERADTKEKSAQVEARGILLKNQSLIIDMKMKDALISNEREKTEALQQENVKRVDLEERARMQSLTTQQSIAKDSLAFQRASGQIEHSEELAALAALENAKFAAARESLERRLELQREGTVKHREIQNQLLALEGERERAALKAEQQITLASTNEHRRRVQLAAEAQLQQGRIEVGIAQDVLASKAVMGEVGAEDELTIAKKLMQDKYDLEVQYLMQKQALYDKDSAEYKALTMQIQIAAAQHARVMNQFDQRMQQQRVADARHAEQSIQHDFQSTISEMMQGSMTWQKGLQNMWKSLTKAFSDFVSKQLTDWLFGEQRKTGISQLWSNVRKMLYPEEAQSEIQSKGTATAATNAMATESASTAITAKATEATAVVSSNAAEAASGAAASASSIPMVGWAMAAGVFAAVLAMVLGAQSNIKSAEGGFDIPTGVNPMVQAHEEEMILPKEYANAIRRMTDQGFDGGRSRGGDTITINAMDSRSMRDTLKRNYQSLTPGLRKLARGTFQKVRR